MAQQDRACMILIDTNGPSPLCLSAMVVTSLLCLSAMVATDGVARLAPVLPWPSLSRRMDFHNLRWILRRMVSRPMEDS